MWYSASPPFSSSSSNERTSRAAPYAHKRVRMSRGLPRRNHLFGISVVWNTCEQVSSTYHPPVYFSLVTSVHLCLFTCLYLSVYLPVGAICEKNMFKTGELFFGQNFWTRILGQRNVIELIINGFELPSLMSEFWETIVPGFPRNQNPQKRKTYIWVEKVWGGVLEC